MDRQVKKEKCLVPAENGYVAKRGEGQEEKSEAVQKEKEKPEKGRGRNKVPPPPWRRRQRYCRCIRFLLAFSSLATFVCGVCIREMEKATMNYDNEWEDAMQEQEVEEQQNNENSSTSSSQQFPLLPTTTGQRDEETSTAENNDSDDDNERNTDNEDEETKRLRDEKEIENLTKKLRHLSLNLSVERKYKMGVIRRKLEHQNRWDSTFSFYGTVFDRKLAMNPFGNDFPTIESMVEAGFRFLSPIDRVVCLTCGIQIDDWLHCKTPINRHREYSPKCLHLRDMEKSWYCCTQKKCFRAPMDQVDGLACFECKSYSFCRCACQTWMQGAERRRIERLEYFWGKDGESRVKKQLCDPPLYEKNNAANGNETKSKLSKWRRTLFN